jgi:hypothetical protein
MAVHQLVIGRYAANGDIMSVGGDQWKKGNAFA